MFLLFSWNLQAEVNPHRIAPHHPIQSTESFNGSNPAIDLPPLSLTATVGTPFSYELAALILSGNVTYTATGLPANGLTFNGNPLGPTISGTPLTAGVLSVTVTATPQNGPSLGPPVSALFLITVSSVSPGGGSLTLLAPTYNCTTGAFTFNTSGGNGTPIEYRAVPGITDWTTNTNQFVDESSRTTNDVQPFLLQARQGGVVTTLIWDMKAACGRARLGAVEPERRLRVVVLGNPVVGETMQVEVSGVEDQPLRVSLTNA